MQKKMFLFYVCAPNLRSLQDMKYKNKGLKKFDTEGIQLFVFPGFLTKHWLLIGATLQHSD